MSHRESVIRKGFSIAALLLGLGGSLAGITPADAVPRSAVATTPATTILPEAATLAASNDGWEFIPTTNIMVTALGYFDYADDGLLLSHDLVIYDAATMTPVTPVVTATSASILVDQFRYESITPITLTAGQAYVVNSAHPGPPIDLFAGSTPAAFAFQPEIGYVAYRVAFTGTLTFPTTIDNSGLYLGPNFQFEEAPVPLQNRTWSGIKTLFGN